LGVSALALGVGATAARADDPVKLTISGHAMELFGYVKNDSSLQQSKVYDFGDAQIVFDGKTKLDNGITVEVNLSQNQSAGLEGGNYVKDYTAKQIAANESDWIAFSGGFGRFEFGDDFNVATLTRFGNDAPYLGQSGYHWARFGGWVKQPGNNANGVQTALMDDYQATKAIYQTPVFAGFQLSANYTPNIGNADNNGATGISETSAGGGDAIATALTYTNTFGGVKINADGEYVFENANNVSGYSAGLSGSLAGFTLGGSILDRKSDHDTTTQTGATFSNPGVGNGVTYDVALQYSNGPWSFAGGYMHGDAKTDLGGQIYGLAGSRFYAVTGEIQYILGPGITVTLENGYLNWKTADNGQTTYSADQNKGFYSLLGTQVNF